MSKSSSGDTKYEQDRLFAVQMLNKILFNSVPDAYDIEGKTSTRHITRTNFVELHFIRNTLIKDEIE